MQDIHSLTGGGGAPPIQHLFAAAAGDRRLLRPPNQSIKCPRCDSLNTKFCYYNNYNLSQPRHFCKSCRRYWTKGGVLRNVPVGGGCRKSKRSSSSSSPSSSKSSSSKPPPSPSLSAAKSQPRDEVTYNSINSSNGDCSVIASAPSPDDIPTLFHEYDASCMEKQSSTDASSLYGIEDIGIDEHHVGGGGGMMTEMGKYPSMNGSTVEMGPLSYGGVMSELDGFGALDWEGESTGGDRGDELFEVTGAVDHAYWSQQIQWTAADDDVVVDHRHHHHQQQQEEAPGGLFLP